MVNYLLSLTHPMGSAKAWFFTQYGFRAQEWEILRDSLADHVRHNPVVRREVTSFGTKYVVEGILVSPDKRNPGIRSVWFVRTSEHYVRFVTAYPLKGSS